MRAATTMLIPIVVVSSLLLFAGGAIFLSQVGLPYSLWLAPWICYCTLAGPLQILLLRVSHVEGTGRRDVAWRAHFFIELTAGLGFLAAIAVRQELWAYAAGASLRVAMILLLLRRAFLLPDDPRSAQRLAHRFSLWRTEIWPMQWKNLVNNLSGLLTTRLLTPILLATQGALVAGQVGIAISIALAIVGITSAWPLSQTALYTKLFQGGQGRQLHSIFAATLFRSSLLALAITAGTGATCEDSRSYSTHVRERLPSSLVLWLVLAAALSAHAAYSFAIFLRARRTDPAVLANVLCNIPALACYWFSAQTGATPFAFFFFGTSIFFACLYGYYLFRAVRTPVQASSAKAAF